MIVCICHRVSDRVIAHGARCGMDFDDIQLEFGVATQCGQCEGCARDIVAQCRASAPVAALQGIPVVPLAQTRLARSAWISSQQSVPA